MNPEEQPAEGNGGYRTLFEQIIELIDAGKYEDAAKKSLQVSLYYAELGQTEKAETLVRVATAVATLIQAKARTNPSWSVAPSTSPTSGGYNPKHHRNEHYKKGNEGWKNGE